MKDVVCTVCGNKKETMGKDMELLCPWCDEARMVEIATKAVHRNTKRIELKLVKK
jgi:DNA-directed RNA polymerase subunit RPC12/RpoP